MPNKKEKSKPENTERRKIQLLAPKDKNELSETLQFVKNNNPLNLYFPI